MLGISSVKETTNEMQKNTTFALTSTLAILDPIA